MQFIFSTPVLIRYLWQLMIFVFMHWYIISAVLLQIHIAIVKNKRFQEPVSLYVMMIVYEVGTPYQWCPLLQKETFLKCCFTESIVYLHLSIWLKYSRQTNFSAFFWGAKNLIKLKDTSLQSNWVRYLVETSFIY